MPGKGKRRNNNEGCIRKRSNGLWEAQYIAGYKNDGRPVRRSIYGKTKSEVMSKLRDTIMQLERDEYVAPNRLTVGEWLDEWWIVYCLPSKKNSTCTGYENEINLHLKPYVGRYLLQDLKAQHVQAAVNALIREGKAPSTIRKDYTILHAALDRAVINQMLLHNPSQHTNLTKSDFCAIINNHITIGALYNVTIPLYNPSSFYNYFLHVVFNSHKSIYFKRS